MLAGTLFVASPALAAARSMSVGMSGSDVVALQNALIAQGDLSQGSNTGYFGSLTLAAVKKFQCAQHIVCSGSSFGLAGPKTQAALGLGGAPAPAQGGTLGGSLTAAATGAFEVSGWIPDWRAATATADVAAHLSKLTSIMPFGFHMSADGHISDADSFDGEPWASLIASAKAKRVKVVPSLEWGSGSTIQAILSNTTSRIALEDEIANLVKSKGYDGIDIDFEAKQSATINYFSTFLKGLYARMGSKWVYCTVEARMPLEDRYLPGQTIPPDATEYANDYVQINKYCDRVEVMAYDQGTVDKRLNIARSAPYAPVADPGWVEDIVRLAAQTISRNKLIVGIPSYGYEYQVTPVNGAFQYKVLWAFNPGYGTQIASQLGITPTRTSANEIGFVYNPQALSTMAPQGNDTTQTQQNAPANSTEQNLGSQVNTTQPFNYVTWSDAQAIKDKVDLAKRLGVRGVAVFSLSGGQDPGMWNVLP